MNLLISANKRGITTFNVTMMIPRILFLMLVVFVIVLFVRYSVVNSFDISSTQAEIAVERLLYSADGISYYDMAIDRSYPLIINPEKCETSYLDKVFSAKNIAVRLVIYKDELPLKTCYINEDWYYNWQPRTSTRVRGSGVVKKYVLEKPVFIMQNGKLSQGLAEFNVLIPQT